MIALDLMGAGIAAGTRSAGRPADRVPDEKLADLDRALTPEEQKRLDAYQSREADKALLIERATSPDGPRAEMTVTREGATLRAERGDRDEPERKPIPWGTLAAVAAVAAVLGSIAYVALAPAPRGAREAYA